MSELALFLEGIRFVGRMALSPTRSGRKVLASRGGVW
jgi:hypothetical protein